MKENSNILRSSWTKWPDTLMTMTYGPKKYNPSSCVAPRQKLTMACDWITNFPSCVSRRLLCHFIMNCRMTNFPSCVARRLLCHLILNCDHNTTLSSYEAHICVEHLHQIRRDEAIKYNWTIVQSSKSGSGSILLYYESKSRRTHSSVPISVNDSRRYNYARKSYERYISCITAKIDDRSCSPAIISINAEKTQPVKKNKQQETRQETISHFCS